MYFILPLLLQACGLDTIPPPKETDTAPVGVSESGETDDSPDDSNPATNDRPHADAGEDFEVEVGATVSLDGRDSSDPDDDALTFTWVMTARPSGSLAELTSPSSTTPLFTADMAGEYVVELMVYDGQLASDPDEVVVTAWTANQAPVANAGADRAVTIGDTVRLDGSASSDPDNDALNFLWAFRSIPVGSGAVLAGTSSVSPSFVADIEGRYDIELVVDDGIDTSAPDVVTVTASEDSGDSCGCPFVRGPWVLAGLTLVLPYWSRRRRNGTSQKT